MMKKSVLNQSDWTQYLIQVYFGKGEPLSCCLDRAYRDFNRTLHGIGKRRNNEILYNEGKKYLRKRIVLLKSKANEFNQTKFDNWHKNTCHSLCGLYKKNKFAMFHIGQAQKWINMTLKYIFTYGDNLLPGYAKIYHFCHVPIDNIILKKLKEYDAPAISCKWSRVDTYEDYYKLQQWFRDKFELIPLEAEFKLWQGERPQQAD